jgi:ABC-type multidrug transport system ATPase subunit
VSGRLAPVLELGVGFSAEMATRDNAVINGVMLGLSRAEARERIDRILEFAELKDFAETKLKNLSSGMKVRLAFATMLEMDPDILLIDEVLAVGDAAFQEKCAAAMMAMRDRGRTVILVTHSMPDIERLCDRALLLENGQIEELGDPEPVAARYMEINLARRAGIEIGDGPDPEDRKIAITHLRVCGPDGQAKATVDAEETIEIVADLEVERVTERPAARLEIRNETRGRIYVSPSIELLGGEQDRVFRPRELPRVRWQLENRLLPGRYTVSLTITRLGRAGGAAPVSPVATTAFVINGPPRRGAGVVDLRQEVEIERSPRRDREAIIQ